MVDKTRSDLTTMRDKLHTVMSKKQRRAAKENVAMLVDKKVLFPTAGTSREGKVFVLKDADEVTEELIVLGNRVTKEALQAVDNVYWFSRMLLDHYSTMKNDAVVKERLDIIASRIKNVN